MLYYKVMQRGNKQYYTLSEIMEIVCSTLEIDIQDFKSKSRKSNIVDGRRMYSYLSKKLTNNSLKSLGEAINRNHSSIIHLVKTCENYMETDKVFQDKLNLVFKEIIH